jgi:SAM-dependent methyltransferase
MPDRADRGAVVTRARPIYLTMKGTKMATSAPNVDAKTVRSFGQEWSTYDQHRLVDYEERTALRFDEYFAIFPWGSLPERPVGADVGCGSGRWALRVARRVGTLHCIDASADALEVARRNLTGVTNCEFHHASVAAMPIPKGSLDFC